MANQFATQISCETGKLCDFRKTKIPTAALFEAESFEAFANFCARFFSFRSREYLFFVHPHNYCEPISIEKNEEKIFIEFEKKSGVKLVPRPVKNKYMDMRYVCEPELKKLEKEEGIKRYAQWI